MDNSLNSTVPNNPGKIFEELRDIDLSRVDLKKIHLRDLRSAAEWIFYVWNDWLDNDWYWTKWEHWWAKSNQRNLAFSEFLHSIRIFMKRWSFKEYLQMQLPALTRRFTQWQIQDIENLLHLFIVAESVTAFQEHMNALLTNQGWIYSVDVNQFNHNWFTWHGARLSSDNHQAEFRPVSLADVRRMRYL
jgi:hypothetical protein